MNKGEFVSHIATKGACTKAEADRIVEMFTSCIMEALGNGEEVVLTGFGTFSVSQVKARAGRNPRTGEAIQIEAYNQPKFKAGQKLKSVCN